MRFRLPILAVVLAVAVLWIYWPARHFGLVNFDDHQYITDNEMVRSGLTFDGVKWAFTTFHRSNWHPLAWISHQLDVSLFGNNVGAYHLVSAAVHALNAVLLLATLRAYTGAFLPSALVAALFAFHPLHVESVAWVAERKDVLSTFFWIAAMAAYLAFVRRPGAIRAFLVPALFAAGLAAKPMVQTLPFVLLLLDIWPLGRLRPDRPGRAAALTRLMMEKAPLLAMTAASAAVSLHAQVKGGAVSSLGEVPLIVRAATAVNGYAWYLLKTVLPAGLSFIYPHPGVLPPWRQTLVSLAAISALTVLAALRFRRQPWLMAGWLWFLGTLVPVLGLVQIGAQWVADRYTYLPHIGLFMALAWAAAAKPRAAWPRISIPAAAAVLAALAVAARIQVGHWRNDESLCRHALDILPTNYLAHNNLGVYLSDQGRLDEAVYHYRRSLAAMPRRTATLNNLGAALFKQGKDAEVAAVCRASLAINNISNAEAYYNLALSLSRLGDQAGAEQNYRLALRIKPDLADALLNLATVIFPKGQIGEAMDLMRKTIELQPNNASAHYNLAVMLHRTGKVAEAIAYYRQALSLNPDYISAKSGLEIALRQAPGPP